MKHVIATTAIVLFLAGTTTALPVFASGKPASGGGGGGNSKPTTTTTPTLTTVSFAAPYYTTGPTGTCTFGYTSDNSYKSLNISASGFSYKDGTELQIEVHMTRPSPVTYYGTVTTVSSGKVVVYGGSAKLYISTDVGNIVPDFPIPTAGTTTLYVKSPTGAYILWATLSQSKQKHSGTGA